MLQSQYKHNCCPSAKLFNQSALIPSELSFADFQWLHECEFKLYSAPWNSNPKPNLRVATEPEIEPTISINASNWVPDSCPASPMYLNEVPDSDPYQPTPDLEFHPLTMEERNPVLVKGLDTSVNPSPESPQLEPVSPTGAKQLASQSTISLLSLTNNKNTQRLPNREEHRK